MCSGRRRRNASAAVDQRRIDRRRRRHAGAVVADAARLGGRVVELRREELHAAPVGGHVVEHQLLLVAAGAGDALDPFGRIRPRLQRAFERLAADAAERALDVELLEHQFELAALDVDHLGELLQRQRSLGPVERGEHGVDVVGGREGGLDEPQQDVGVFPPAQQHGVAGVEGAAGAADLLVVADRRARHLEVDDEAEVGLVVPHPERGGGHEHLELVGQQAFLEPFTFLRVGGAGVRRGVDAVGPQPVGDHLGVAHGEAVDDARPGHRRGCVGRATPAGRSGGGVAARRGRGRRARAAPRNVVSVVPSCSATSLTTRSLAVAVQPSTGTRPDPKPATSRPTRR